MILIILLSLSFCLLFAWWMRHHRRLLRTTHNIPIASRQLPFLGCVHRIIGDHRRLWEFVKELSVEVNDKNGIATFWLGPTVFNIVITDPTLSYTVSNTCLDKSYFYSWGKDFVGDGLITAEANLWKRHRKLLNPAFNQNVLNGFIQVFNKQSSKIVKRFSDHLGLGYFKHDPIIFENSLETICQTAMGLPEDKIGIVDKTYVKAFDKFFKIYLQRFRRIWEHPQIIFNMMPNKKEHDSCVKILCDVSNSVLEKAKESNRDGTKNMVNFFETKQSANRFKPFIDLLFEESEKGLLSDKEVTDEVNTIIAAGYETTATTLVIALVMVGSHAAVQENIFSELQETFGGSDREVTKEDLSKLVYLEAVIKETLRLHPVVPVVIKTTYKDVQIDTYTIPAGTQLFHSIWGTNRHPSWGPDRNEFVPDRWLSPNTLPSNPNAFAAFSIGKRNCIGKTYAMMIAKVTLAHILRKYRVKADHTKIEFQFDFVMKLVAGNQISIEPR